jgi:hypothetical protein
MKKIDLTNQKFNRLTVIKLAGKNNFGKTILLCMCDCGNKSFVTTGSLRGGHTKSCGCLRVEVVSKKNITHGETKGRKVPRLYTAWVNMRERCSNQKNIHYTNYGGRGINVCKKWVNSYINFSQWARRNGYKENLTLDRINNSKGYSPENCRWITPHEQNRNQRTNVVYKGEVAADASIRLGGKKDLVSHRINKCGWSLEEAFTIPVRGSNK